MEEDNVEKEASGPDDPKRIVSSILGFLGAIDSAAIGFYILSVIFNTTLVTNLMVEGYLVLVMTGATIMMLLTGSLWILKRETRQRGAATNLAAGIILASLYIYYTYISKPTLLQWLHPTGIILIVLPILSGIIGKSMPH